MPKSHKIMYALYILFWIIMAIDPKYRADWLLENVLIFIFFPYILWMDKKLQFTFTTIFFILIFASLHTLGSHYTYAEMEHFNVITQFFGFERNHYDRLVHFFFGLLMFRVLFEIILKGFNTLKAALFFNLTLIIAISALYELLEWAAVLVFNPELGMAFLGIQGDIWDAHKDSALALLGALINILFYRSYQRLWELKTESQPSS
jgi:putative membrane protein